MSPTDPTRLKTLSRSCRSYYRTRKQEVYQRDPQQIPHGKKTWWRSRRSYHRVRKQERCHTDLNRSRPGQKHDRDRADHTTVFTSKSCVKQIPKSPTRRKISSRSCRSCYRVHQARAVTNRSPTSPTELKIVSRSRRSQIVLPCSQARDVSNRSQTNPTRRKTLSRSCRPYQSEDLDHQLICSTCAILRRL